MSIYYFYNWKNGVIVILQIGIFDTNLQKLVKQLISIFN